MSDAGIRAVLFDFGGVILSSPFEAFRRYEQEKGLPADFLRTVNARDPNGNAWAQLERGEVGVVEFCRRFEEEALQLGHQLEGRDVLALLGGEVRPEMVTALARCRQHFKTGLLTNNFLSDPTLLGERFGSRSQEVERVLAMFDVVVESWKVGVRKPEPRFYEISCELLAIEPPEAVFLDDLGVNLKPARAMGMHTIKVESPRQAIADLADVLGIELTDRPR